MVNFAAGIERTRHDDSHSGLISFLKNKSGLLNFHDHFDGSEGDNTVTPDDDTFWLLISYHCVYHLCISIV